MEQSIPITGEQEHSAQTDTLELRKGIEILLCNTYYDNGLEKYFSLCGEN